MLDERSPAVADARGAIAVAFAAGWLAQAAPARGADVLFEDFGGGGTTTYRVLAFTPGRDGAEFGFDYGVAGIPEAPNSPVGAVAGLGLRLFANNPSEGTVAGASAVQIIPSMIGGQIAGLDYRFTFDLWMNVNGPLPGGGAGSTEAFMAGVGWNGPVPIQAGTENGTYFTITGEGGSATDVRSFTNDGFNAPGTNTGPSPDTSDPYYAGVFPGGTDVGALPGQGGVDNQTGTTVPGQMAFGWHEVLIDVAGSGASFYVDGLPIARDADAERTGNVMVGYADYFESVSDAPQWSFGLVDNMRVQVVPEPGAVALGLAGLGLLALGRGQRGARGGGWRCGR